MKLNQIKIPLDQIIVGIIVGAILSGTAIYFMIYKDVNILKVKVASIEAKFLEIKEWERPSYMSDDEYYLNQGIIKYEAKSCEEALLYFNKIANLSGNDFVRWKYFESLCKFKLLQHQKYKRIEQIDLAKAREIEYTLHTLMQKYPEHRLSEAIKYWRGQTLYHFLNRQEDAYNIFSELHKEYWYGTWKEGTLYYMSEILLKSGNEKKRVLAIRYLNELLQKYPDGLIRVIEDDTTYRVKNIISKKLSNLN